MKRPFFAVVLIAAFLAEAAAANAQGIVTFDQPWVGNNAVHYLWFYNDPSGMSFSISPQMPDNYLERLTGVNGHPTNGSPHLEHTRFGAIQSLTTFNRLNASPFGLLSVDLADPVAPSTTPISITFNGFKTDGSMVSQTFTTSGSGSSFQTYLFNSDFAVGLARVEIPSAAWAMDNIVWIPEPSAVSLILLGSGVFVHVHRRNRKQHWL